MSRAPRCIECDLERVSVEVEWATTGYQINCYECPSCKSVLRLVEPQSGEPTIH